MMTLIRDRLRVSAGSALRLVEQVAEWSRLDAPPPDASLPAAYVLPLGSQPGPNAVATGVRQRVQETFGVVLVLRNLRDARGGAATADITQLRDLVRVSLVGWQPGPEWEPVLLGSGRLLAANAGLVTWQDTYTTAVLLRGA